jgi:hypothetical protein
MTILVGLHHHHHQQQQGINRDTLLRNAAANVFFTHGMRATRKPLTYFLGPDALAQHHHHHHPQETKAAATNNTPGSKHPAY